MALSEAVLTQLAQRPDVTKAPPLDLGGLAGQYLGGLEAGRGLASRKAAGEDLGVSDYAGGFARGILRGPAIQRQTEDPLGDIKVKLGQQNVQMQDIAVEEALRRRDEAIRGRAAAAQFLPIITDHIRNQRALDPQVQQEVLGWLAANPEAFDDPRVKQQYELFNRSKVILQGAAAAQRARQQPGAIESVKIGPDGGATTEIGVPTQQASSSTDIRNFDFERQLRSRVEGLPAGSPERAQAEAELQRFIQSTTPRGMVVRSAPDGGFEVVQGITQNDLTNQQRGTVKLQADKLTDTATRVGELIPLADQLFGPIAAGKTVIVDRLLANINPALAEGQRIQGRTKAALTKEGIIRSLGEGQGQLSNKDIQRFEQALFELGNIKEATESPQRAREILKSLQKEMARDAFERFKTRDMPADSRTLRMMDPFIIRKELKQGRITEEQFRDAINNNVHQDDVDRLLKEKL